MLSVYSPEQAIEITDLLPKDGRFSSVKTAQLAGELVFERLLLQEGEWTELPAGINMSTKEIPASCQSNLDQIPAKAEFRSTIGGGKYFSSVNDLYADSEPHCIEMFEYGEINTLVISQSQKSHLNRIFATIAATVVPLEEILDTKLEFIFAGY